VRRLAVVALTALAACAGSRHALLSRATVTTAPTTTAAVTSTTTAVAADDSAALATQLVAVETAVRAQVTSEAELYRLGPLQQQVYRRLAHHPDWLAAVLGSTPPTLQPAVRANLTAQLELQALTPPRTDLPAWKIGPPAPAADLLRAYHESEAASGVPWAYLAAIHFVETRMGRIHSPSTAGALGPMQFLPSTWATYGRGDVNNDRDAILAAGRFLRAHGAPAAMASALFRYNPSAHYVRAITAYAEVIGGDERAWFAYYHWPVLVRLVSGDVVLPDAAGQ
jgi:membrane-bound lytic murein transglycosylase B